MRGSAPDCDAAPNEASKADASAILAPGWGTCRRSGAAGVTCEAGLVSWELPRASRCGACCCGVGRPFLAEDAGVACLAGCAVQQTQTCSCDISEIARGSDAYLGMYALTCP